MGLNAITLISVFVLGLLVHGIGQFIIKNPWANFKWNVLGIRPKILDAKTVDATVAECSYSFASSLEKYLKEDMGIVVTAEPNPVRANVESYTSAVIERYIENFVKA
jgi:hypothetical protein